MLAILCPCIYFVCTSQFYALSGLTIKSLDIYVINCLIFFPTVPSLAANLLSAYQMTHTSSPKRVIFAPDSVEIIDISTGNIIAKGAANHASKAYEFSHFLPFLEPVHSQLPLERGGKNILSTPFAVSTSISESKAEESIVSFYEIEFHSD